MNTIGKTIERIAIPLITIAGIILVAVVVNSVDVTNKENNAYIRVINCIISYPSLDPTQADIEQCYRTVEKDLGVTLQRYDSARP